MNGKEINTAILTGVITGLTISVILGAAAYIAYQKIYPSVQADLTAAENSPIGSVLGSL